jgi:hypothetical protein
MTKLRDSFFELARLPYCIQQISLTQQLQFDPSFQGQRVYRETVLPQTEAQT